MLKLIIYIFVFIGFFILFPQKKKPDFQYGVNGHPFTQEAYLNNIYLQIKQIKSLKCKFYRFDLPINSNGYIVNENIFLESVKKFHNNGIKMLPVLVFTREVYNLKSSEDAYTSGLMYGRTFSRRYKNIFSYYEIGNEEDNSVILPQRHGNNINDYDTTKAKIMIPYFKGVCEAIKKEDVSAKLIINHSWVHWGFLELLKKYGVKYDIIGLHWYSDMGDLNDASGDFGNVIDDLHKLFNKRIWITEINIKDGSSIILKEVDTNWFSRNLNFIRYNKYVDAIFIYELFDQPAFSSNESSYGLGRWQGRYSKILPKPLSNKYKFFIKLNP